VCCPLFACCVIAGTATGESVFSSGTQPDGSASRKRGRHHHRPCDRPAGVSAPAGLFYAGPIFLRQRRRSRLAERQRAHHRDPWGSQPRSVAGAASLQRSGLVRHVAGFCSLGATSSGWRAEPSGLSRRAPPIAGRERSFDERYGACDRANPDSANVSAKATAFVSALIEEQGIQKNSKRARLRSPRLARGALRPHGPREARSGL
jgi:hypothetical protein